MTRVFFTVVFCGLFGKFYSQLFVARDTVTVIENGNVLKMPWAGGINFSNVSNIDLNFDGKKDMVVFDRINQFGIGRFRCFINNGAAGEINYSADPSLSYKFPSASNWAVLRDYNCDGKEDIFCSTSAGIMVYKNVSTTLTGISFVLEKSLLYSNFQPVIGNLYASVNAVPGIDDIDGDGDLDILTYAPTGVVIEFHRNLSIENYSNCDSLEFELATGCWGNIMENNCTVTMNYTCAMKSPGGVQTINDGLHAGSCLTCLDSDGDGDKDLIVGDIGCNFVQYAHNTGSPTLALMTDTTKLYPNFPAKANTTPIRINNFPCAYYVDVDGDNKKDLVATPNSNGSENTQSVWYYKNTSATGTVNFEFVKKNLFQDEMIEVGQNSFPVLFDYNADGKKDLLIGTYGYYVPTSLRAKLTLYGNIGTNAAPVYSLITRDYAGVSTYSLNTVIPTTGDVDGDGDTDILLGTQTGQIHWLENTAGPGVPCNFSVFKNNPFGFTTPSAAAAPQLFDIDGDGKPDLMIGGKNGRIMHYQNIGTLSVPQFTLVNSFFGNVDVKGPSTLYGTDGYAAPFFYNEAGSTRLLVGSVTGQIYYYSVPSPTSSCVLIDNYVNGINEGGQSTVFFEDVNGDNKRDLFTGNGSGGLSFFSSMGPDVLVKERNTNTDVPVNLFPNPASESLYIRIDKTEVESGDITVNDILGNLVLSKKLNSNFETLGIKTLPPGIYFVTVKINYSSRPYIVTKKIVKE